MGADLTYLTSVDAILRRIVGVSGAYAWSIELASSLLLLPYLYLYYITLVYYRIYIMRNKLK
jgi:hypothetical protein